jgi:DNA modification methylase
MSYELIYKKVGDLLPYINNARTHSEEQINQIAASIREFGFTNPLLIDGVGTIIAGHGRLHGAKKSGLEEVPCIVLDHLTKAQQKALIIADNQLALNAGWDMDLLSVEMKDLDAEGFDLSLMGFNDDMLANMLKEETEGLTDEDAVPEVPDDPVTVLGDVWVLGKHRLMCGDSTSIDAVEKLMGGQKANMAFTSPPYNAGKSELLSGNTHSGDNKYGDYNDDKSDSEYLDLLVGFTNAWINACEFLAVNLQQLAGNKTSFVDYMGAYKDNLIDVCIWDKGHATPAIEFSKVHAATFPVAFAEWAVESFTSLNAIVADPFGGTGTTMIAAEKHNRVCMMMELDPKYCDVIIQRWCDFTGEDAILERTGETFSVLKKGSGKNAA